MCGPPDDLILHGLAQLDKMGTVAGNPYDYIFVFLRNFLGLKQDLFIDNIKLWRSDTQ